MCNMSSNQGSKHRNKHKIGSESASDTKSKSLNLSIKLTDTGEVFQLKSVSSHMTVKELKSYLEFVTGIPVVLQRLHYLDETELQDSTDIKFNDIVSGGQLHMTIWHTWIPLITAVVKNNIPEVMRLGVTSDSTFNTPNSEYMSAKNRQNWLAERAFVSLFVASHRGHQKLVDALVSSGADVNRKTKYGRTPLHVAAAQGKGSIVDILLNNGADVNEVDEFGDTPLAIAERFGHKDGARHLFLFRWQVRAAQTEKVPEMPLYFHQQCDTANPAWLSGTQGQMYYASKEIFVDEFAGSHLQASKATQRASQLPPDDRVTKKISHVDWLSEKEKEEEVKLAVVRAAKAAKKLEEEKKREQHLIDKESYETWVKKQQEQKERQQLQKKIAQANKQKQNNKGGGGVVTSSVKGASSVRTSDNFESQSERETDSNLSELLSHLKTSVASSTNAAASQPHGYYITSDGLLFENEHEAFDKVKNIQLKRATDRRNLSIIPNF